MFENLLVVCIGNICRSPMAEGYFNSLLIPSIKYKSKLTVKSAGLSALIGKPPDEHACGLLLEAGVNISDYRAKQLNSDMIKQADLILVMEYDQKKIIEERYSMARGKVFLIGHWDGFEVPDPYQKDVSHFKHAFGLIKIGAEQWLKKL